MGKRSRKRGATDVAERPRPPRDEAATAPAQARPPRGARPPKQSQYADAPATSFFGRVAESWRLAGERPAQSIPKDQRIAARPERPPGLFGGAPISEIVMLVGLVGLIIGFAQGPNDGAKAISVSLAVIALATFEITAREHFAGYRSRTFFLALLATVAFHAAVSFVFQGDTTKSPLMIFADVALFAWLCAILGNRYKRARLELRGGAR